MLAFFANIFGYVLEFLYNMVGNYGVAIILFSVLVKVLMIPISLKQQKSMKKNTEMQEELKQIQFKYKNDPEKMNQEVMALYKREGASPFSGCLSSIIQIVLLLSVFLLVRSPLTYMVKMDPTVIEKLEAIVSEQDSNTQKSYAEIAVIQYVRKLENAASVSKNEKNNEKNIENNLENNSIETNSIENNGNTDNANVESTTDDFKIEDYVDQINLNMNFLGIDLSQVPTSNLKDFKVLIIPILYVISSFISIRMSSSTSTSKDKMENKKLITDGNEEKDEERYNPAEDINKTMMWMMPIMSVSIAIIAPLGLALYWLMNNILMIAERLVYNKILNKEEAEKNA